ncbi:PhnE/PtxC family ABC transporter permease [Chelativorans petroleitrophicus]|uniref:PhnE/PtxC family ABC transporter permease n=1 Tax=Chelativorans petroleitrophicus TaxID=2975484 RepID=UPI00311AF763
MFGAKNINRLPVLRFSVRRGFDVIRAFETLILALIFIRAFGLGPLAGVLAIAIGEIGVLGKLYAEAIENTSKKPVDGVMAAGGSWLQSIHFGVMPQAIPVILSITLTISKAMCARARSSASWVPEGSGFCFPTASAPTGGTKPGRSSS